MQNNAHYRVRYMMSYRHCWLVYLKMKVEMAKVDMVANQADKQKFWEVMQSWQNSKCYLLQFIVK